MTLVNREPVEKLAKSFAILMKIDRNHQRETKLLQVVNNWADKNSKLKFKLLEYLQKQETSFTVNDFLIKLNIKGYLNNAKFLDLLCSYDILTASKQHKAGKSYIVNHENLKLLEN